MPTERRTSGKRKVMATINMTPLVDITMVLLIIFMVTATFVKDPVVPIELPSAANAEDALVDTFSLVLDEEGTLHVNGKEISHEDARNLLEAAYAKNPDVQAVVAADGAVPHREVVRLIDLVKSAGITKFAMGVRTEHSKP